MSFRDFQVTDIQNRFALKNQERIGTFAKVPRLAPSMLLTQWLEYNVPLAAAIGNEKARSEFIIAPILSELKRTFDQEIGLFSGVEFNVDPEKGLSGTIDFLISQGSEQLVYKAPVLLLVEAKRENISEGLGQCAAEMVAARIFNERANSGIRTIYGAVTTGSLWKFMKLEEQTLHIDLNEYTITQIDLILGILRFMTVPSTST